MAIKLVREPEPGPGTLGKPELYALAIGQVIGAGVITLVVPAIKMTGYSAWLAYFVAILMGFFMILPTVFVSSTVRLGGGNYSMLAGLAGPNIAGIYAFMYLTQCLSLSLFGSSAAAYLGDIIPALSSHTARIIIGAGLLTLFYVVNLLGIDIMASAQKLMTWLLIAALMLFAIVGIFKMQLPIFDFSDPAFLTQGWGVNIADGQITGGFLGATLLFVYSTQGYYMTTAYGGSSRNAKRDIPFVLLLCVPTLCVLYVGVAMAGVGSTTLEEYGASTTLVVAARNLFPTVLFYFFIIGGPIMALLSTLNSSFAYNSITIGTACDDGWLPKAFGKKNAKGGRVWILTFMYIVGMIPILFGLSITTITNMVQLIGACYAFLNFKAYISMPKLYPDAWAKSRYHIPNGAYYFLCCVSLAGFMVTLWKSCLSMSPGLVAANIIAIVVLAIAGFIRGKKGDVEIHTSIWCGDAEGDEKAAAMMAASMAKQ